MNMRVERKKYLDHKIDISCIILSNLNDSFVKERIIPSIIRNSKSHSIEIIVSDNSPTQNFEYEGVKVIHTEPYHIPKAYNMGVSESKGKYIALFHDDCELFDDEWIDKLISELNNDIYAVSPEKYNNLEGSFLKEVPLVMERKNFLDIGGYDETYYFGYEDIGLSEKIFNKGKNIKQVKIGYKHYGGMSSILMTCDKDLENHYKNMFLDKNIPKENFYEIHHMVMKKFWKCLNIEYSDIGKTSWKKLYKKMPKTKKEVKDLVYKLKN